MMTAKKSSSAALLLLGAALFTTTASAAALDPPQLVVGAALTTPARRARDECRPVELGEGAGTPCSFHEAEHLGGDTDMVALVAAVLREEARRRKAGRRDASIPFRPDHGQDILDDLKRKAQPGYPAVGRLKGLAELRGIAAALGHQRHGLRP